MRTGRGLICVALGVALACAAASPAAAEEGVTLNFVNAEIEGVVKAVSDITGKNFILDPRVKGTVNIVSAKPLAPRLVYDVFLSALRLQGYATVEERGVVKIIPENDAKVHATTVARQGDAAPGGDAIRTHVFTLKHESAAQLLPVLRPLIAPNNTISAYPNGNTLVVTDYAGNLRRIEQIIEAIDQPSSTEPVLIAVRHASALDVAQTVSRLLGDATPAGGAPADAGRALVVVADARSNSVLAKSEHPAQLTRVRSLVAMLDTPTSAAGNMHVIYLKNAEAVKVAETLRSIYQDNAAAAPRAASVPPLPSGAGAPGASTTAAPRSTASASIVQADPATNSIIVTAPDPIYNNLRAVVDKLDVRRAQVYVEALIAEMTADKAAEFGIQWQDVSALGNTDSNARGFGGTNFGGAGQNIIGVARNPTAVGRGLNVGVLKGRVTVPGVGEIVNLGVLVRALESDTNVNILSTPTLLTLDNEEARIVIGKNVPFITGQYALSGAAATPTPFQTIERRDVGLTLRIKPQISEGGAVRLQLYQEVSSIDDRTNPAGLITNKRSVESTVLVDDTQIVAIGGLIQDTVTDTVEKVPVLGDIPGLGALFQYKSRGRTKTNLMVFLRPTVLRDSQRASALAGERYDYIVREQLRVTPAYSAVLPPIESPKLPPRTEQSPAPDTAGGR